MAASGPSLAESLAEERGTDIADSELGPMRLARRLLMRGETLQSGEFAEEQRCSSSVLSQALIQMRLLGFTTEAMDDVMIDDRGRKRPIKRYRLINTDHVPTEAQLAAVTEANRKRTTKHRAVKEKKKKPPVQREVAATVAAPPKPRSVTHAMPLPALPELGTQLTVYALALNEDDGSITLGLHNGSRQWLTTVIAQSER